MIRNLIINTGLNCFVKYGSEGVGGQSDGKWVEESVKKIQVDCTGFLVYAIVKNARCLNELEDYMERGTEECYQAYLVSEYADTPFIEWFPVHLRMGARLCLGLLQRIRQGDEDAYRIYIKIGASGHKKMKNELRTCQKLDGTMLSSLSREKDLGSRLSILVLGLVLAQDLAVPIVEDYDFYRILWALYCYEKKMFSPMEEVVITDQGKKCQKKFEGQYPCNEFHKCYVESVDWQRVSDPECKVQALEHASDYKRIFSTFHVNPQAFHGIRLSREEIQKICSADQELTWRDYEPLLLMGTLCKYIDRISRSDWEAEAMRLREKVKDLKREVENSKNLIQSMRGQLSRMAMESCQLSRQVKQCREAVHQKKDCQMC